MEKACVQCEAVILEDSRYCSQCGVLQPASNVINVTEGWRNLQQACIFYALELAVCLLFDFCKPIQTFVGLIVIHVISALYTVYFIAINWERSKVILRWNNFSALRLAVYIGVAVCASLLVNSASGWINRSLFSQDISYYLFFSTNKHSTFVFLLFVAVIPALFEELAYRGYLLPTLLKALDRQQAIFVTSFLFAIIHLSFLSLFWLIPFALFLGYVSIKENTMWYGVAIHFAFNLTACMFELFL